MLLELGRPLTDAGAAERIAHMYAGRLRWVQGLEWLRWDGKRWQPGGHHDHTDAAIAHARELWREARDRQAEAEREDDKATVAAMEAVKKYARRAENAGPIKQALSLAAHQPAIFATAKDLNRDPWLFVHQGGTVDLRTGRSRPHAPSDLTTICAPANANAVGFSDGVVWDKFLKQVLPDDELRGFVQRAVGQSLIGLQREHAWFMATGGGGNGKGTFFRALKAALGEYYGQLPANFFIVSDRERHPTELMNLLGRRLVVSAELPADKPLDETKLKELTGGDPITAHYMGKDDVTFEPSHSSWICCNRKPRVKATDQGFWRRANVVPFTVTIAAADRDHDLDAKLAAEKNAVLAWALEGCEQYMREGLGSCKAVDDATAEYREDQDFFGSALYELCDIGYLPSGELRTVRKTDLREALALYYAAAGFERVPTDPTIKQELKQRLGATECRPRNDGWHWEGLSLKDLVVANLRRDAQEAQDAKRGARKSWADKY